MRKGKKINDFEMAETFNSFVRSIVRMKNAYVKFE